MATYSLTFDHGITADEVLSFAISQAEGDFATLEILVKNPRVGLLSGSLFATFARNGTTLIYGRLIGVPEDLQANAVKLVFLARPDTYDADKATLAATLRADPIFWDPVWIAPDRRLDADAVLESRPQLWHTDRVTHALTVSDIIQGEAGIVVIDPETVPHDSLHMTYGETPAELISCKAQISWRQRAKGQLDISPLVLAAFTEAGSTFGSYILTYTGGGFLDDWPKIGARIGGGWSVGNTAYGRNDDLTVVLPVAMATGGFKGVNVPPGGGDIFVIDMPVFDVVYGGGLEDWADGSFQSS